MIADAVYRTRLRTDPDKKLMFIMLACSLILHGGVVLVALSEWGFSRAKFSLEPVYSVELVSLPEAKTKKYPAFGRKTRTDGSETGAHTLGSAVGRLLGDYFPKISII